MVNLILTSEMRVGSRWLHYLLKDLLQMKVSGELDGKDIPACQEMVNQRFKENRIVKFHHANQEKIFSLKGDYKVIGIVRNPRDRMVSWTFHQRYKPPGLGLEAIKNAKNDMEAVEVCTRHPMVIRHNEEQLKLMDKNFSTKQFYKTNPSPRNYIWTCYHWLKQNTVREINTIVDFLGLNLLSYIKIAKIKQVCRQHSFKSRSKREAGKEERMNEWFRKGTESDYTNWFSKRMIMSTKDQDNLYWDKIYREERNGN